MPELVRVRLVNGDVRHILTDQYGLSSEEALDKIGGEEGRSEPPFEAGFVLTLEGTQITVAAIVEAYLVECEEAPSVETFQRDVDGELVRPPWCAEPVAD